MAIRKKLIPGNYDIVFVHGVYWSWADYYGKKEAMNQLEIIDNSISIKETIGFKILDDIDIIDIPNVVMFCRIVYNYLKMTEIKK